MEHLRPNQRDALNHILSGDNILLTGPAGTGKSEIITAYRKSRNQARRIAITSTTGISALILKGRTIHAYAGIGLGKGDVQMLVTKILKEPHVKYRWKALETLIIDEISMLSAELFDKLEEIARIVRGSTEPFGGIQLVLSGDFLQLPTVEGEFCFKAKSWERCIRRTVYLTEIIRQSNNKFQECLNAIRIGEFDREVTALLETRLNAVLDVAKGVKPTKLFATNRRVNEINEEELDVLAADQREFIEYEMEIVPYPGIKSPQKDFTINKYLQNTTVPPLLQICVGAQVMLLTNLSLEEGLVNGSRGVVIGFVEDYPSVRFSSGQEKVISMYTWEHEDHEKPLFRVTQIPLRIAYACSIHKAQGGTLDCAEIDLSDIFEYGQAYVALSRVKDLNCLRITAIALDRIRVHPEALAFYNDLKKE